VKVKNIMGMLIEKVQKLKFLLSMVQEMLSSMENLFLTILGILIIE